MTRNRKFVLFVGAALAFCSMAIPARTQDTAAPINAPQQVETPGKRPRKAHFRVLHMMSNAIQVQSLADNREIHTFTYSDRIHGEMQYLYNHGGYQYGDRVKILYRPDSEIALKIEGRPSPPKTF